MKRMRCALLVTVLGVAVVVSFVRLTTSHDMDVKVGMAATRPVEMWDFPYFGYEEAVKGSSTVGFPLEPRKATPMLLQVAWRVVWVAEAAHVDSVNVLDEKGEWKVRGISRGSTPPEISWQIERFVRLHPSRYDPRRVVTRFDPLWRVIASMSSDKIDALAVELYSAWACADVWQLRDPNCDGKYLLPEVIGPCIAKAEEYIKRDKEEIESAKCPNDDYTKGIEADIVELRAKKTRGTLDGVDELVFWQRELVRYRAEKRAQIVEFKNALRLNEEQLSWFLARQQELEDAREQ